MRWVVVCIGLWYGLGSWASAQIGAADTSRWQLGISAQTTLLAGNLKRLFVLTEGQAVYLDSLWGFATRNRYQYGTFGNRLTENDVISRNFVYLFPRARLYPYLMFWAESRLLIQLQQRLQMGGGGTFVWVNTPRHGVRTSLSVTHETARYAQTDYSEDRYDGNAHLAVQRVTLRLAGMHSIGTLRLGYEAWWQPALQYLANYRLRAEAWANLGITRRLRFQVSYIYQFESVHLSRLNPADHLLLAGLSWQLISDQPLFGL